jgi:hypothetical protein
MSGAEKDPVVNRAIEELRRLPALDRKAVERVVQAAATARVTPADDIPAFDRTHNRWTRTWQAVGLAAAAAIIGFVARGVSAPKEAQSPPRVAAPTTQSSAPSTLRSVAANPAEVAAIQHQFVLEQVRARRVSLVGDFNNWNPAASPMTRTGDRLWSVIVPVVPGRHVYGFMVDDSVFTLDPRAPKARDRDLGGEGSMIMIGRP